MAEATRHANDVGPHEVAVSAVSRVVVVFFSVPVSFCRRIELRIRIKPQTDDARGPAIYIRVDIRLLLTLIDPETVLIGLRRGSKARLVDHAAVAETRRALARIDGAEQVTDACTIAGHRVPECFVAGSPQDPGITAFAFRV